MTSEDCRRSYEKHKARRQEEGRENYAQNKAAILAKAQAKRDANRVFNTTTCRRCQKPIVSKRKREFCDRTCRDSWRARPNPVGVQGTLFCHNCTEPITRVLLTAIYCSKKCKVVGWRVNNADRVIAQSQTSVQRRRAERISQRPPCVCGKPLLPRAHKCDACLKQAQQQATITYKNRATEKLRTAHSDAAQVTACQECGIQFCALYGHSRLSMCDDCIEARDKRDKAIHRMKRKMILRNVWVEHVDPYVVFKRDGWACYLCGVPTLPELRGTHHAHAPELDHVVPISKGGLHEYANVRTAHRSCNQLKSNGPAILRSGQVMLL